jgi:hypothetical protein
LEGFLSVVEVVVEVLPLIVIDHAGGITLHAWGDLAGEEVSCLIDVVTKFVLGCPLRKIIDVQGGVGNAVGVKGLGHVLSV